MSDSSQGAQTLLSPSGAQLLLFRRGVRRTTEALRQMALRGDVPCVMLDNGRRVFTSAAIEGLAKRLACK